MNAVSEFFFYNKDNHILQTNNQTLELSKGKCRKQNGTKAITYCSFVNKEVKNKK